MKTRLGKLAAITAAAALVFTGCSADDNADSADGKDDGGINTSPIRMSIVPGWDEGIASTYLWKAVLEDKGYNVEVVEVSDAGLTFAGLASEDIDVYTDTWLPTTHESFVEEYGDQIADLGAWNDEARLTFAVNEDAPIDSLTELAEHAQEFDNRIIGIEPGTGMAELTNNVVIPTYGLEDMDFITSSTAAMLSELKGAIERGDNIVVTLWQPHWAYDEFPIRNLDDPEETFGVAESMHTYARASFAEDYPEVAQWLNNFKMDSELLHSLENVMFNEYDGTDYEPIVAEWIQNNQDYVDSLTN